MNEPRDVLPFNENGVQIPDEPRVERVDGQTVSINSDVKAGRVIIEMPFVGAKMELTAAQAVKIAEVLEEKAREVRGVG